MTENEFVSKIQKINGRVFLVGGYVRDLLQKKVPKDRDYVITGVTEETFKIAFSDSEKVGNSFPVYLVEIDNEKCEVAFARKERKVGTGYHGFKTSFTSDITIEDDLYRRDTTMNSIALELPDRILIDPYNGKEDIENKIVRATSKHFRDDPVRALRAARQATQHGFTIDKATIKLMNLCKEELRAEPTERVFAEMEKALKSNKPSLFFRYLKQADILDITFPEIYNLIGKIHSTVHHPEGDAFEHSMEILDYVSQRSTDIITRFCALVHDIGKGETPIEMLPHHYEHEKRGLDIIDTWNSRMTLPVKWLKSAKYIIKNHMKLPVMKKIGKIVQLLMEADKLSISLEDIGIVLEADRTNSGRKVSYLPIYLQKNSISTIVEQLKSIKGDSAPDRIQGKAVGEWLLNRRAELLRIFINRKNQWLKTD